MVKGEKVMEIEYKGYVIDNGLVYENLITVFYNGDDLIFKSVEDAKEFIDEITQ
jgi:hypothetical protein